MPISQRSGKFTKVGKLIGITAVFATAVNGQTLLHHWKLDGDALDSIGDADGTLEGGAVFTTGNGGQFGEALSLDGDGDALRIQDYALKIEISDLKEEGFRLKGFTADTGAFVKVGPAG